MGAGPSHGELADNDCLLRLAGELEITIDDPFWDTFLTFSLNPPISSQDDKMLTDRLKSICDSLVINNRNTSNFKTLIRLLLQKTNIQQLEMNENNILRFQIFNGLFIARYFLKYLVQNTKEIELINQFELQTDLFVETSKNYFLIDGIEVALGDRKEYAVPDDINETTSFKFISLLVKIVSELKVNDFTYSIHVESLNCILIFLSTQMYTIQPSSSLIIYKIFMENIDPIILSKALLQKYIEQNKGPDISGGSIIFGLASNIWNILTLSSNNPTNTNQSPLSSLSISVLLVLVNHCTSPPPPKGNPYRSCISSLSENLITLYKFLGDNPDAPLSEEKTLLLYHLIHCNNNFKSFLLARTDIEVILIPLLRTIYNTQTSRFQHMYMALIVLLILTEDQLFNKTVHSIILKSITWYQERMVSEISLGGLIILVTTRTAQFNLLKMRDKYLHINCFAALANMSSQFNQLHPYVCQRMISLYEVLSKTFLRCPNQDMSAIEEALRIVLEVINSCLCNQLIHNPNLVYALLYQRKVFEPLKSHEAFHDVIQNIDMVITFFSAKLEKEEELLNSSDVTSVLARVQHWSLQWPRDLMKKFPDLKFKYVEEEKPEEFFSPYVWSLVNILSNISFESTLYKLS
ncbi:dymeclin isoform X1 [Daktulosphaira vitifoliae]|uniref:dymeclin isoform X1 n=1 Tax=Daktulosphaira vitifoliae TaxID=58002 RepID=UPI0021A9F15A|nr:dymeclin isoform X1 [Daktulosphaira vitifoliae]XP_050521534.1 dymeclin isoform X1 [Daktulosphaira vitifoliae]